MSKTFLWVLLLLLAWLSGYAQCGDETYELTIAKAGKDIVLVRDFKVKLNGGNKRNPSPSSKFSVLMQKGLTYRFVIAKDKTSSIEPILQLMDRNEVLGTTFDTKNNKNLEQFEYQCPRTGSYKVIISMNEAKASCAIGVMAMVTDSAFYAQGNTTSDTKRYILYAGIKTPLTIYTDQPEVKRTEITTERGEIISEDSTWFALIPTAGPLKINVKLYDKNDSIVEAIDQDFSVIPLPKPTITIEGTEKGYLSLVTLGPLLKLKVSPSVYQIREFYLSSELTYNSGLHSNNEYFTNEMMSFLESLPFQQRFYINDIQVQLPDGTLMDAGYVMYHIR